MAAKHFRSLLFVPASKPDMLERAHERGADAVIVDLEDGVAEADKRSARASVVSQLETLRQRGVETFVRINALACGGRDDITALANSSTSPLLLPKVSTPEQVVAVEEAWAAATKTEGTLTLLPMIECPNGLFRAQQIARAAHCVSALVFGSEDFAAASGLSATPAALSMPAQWVALAAAAAGIPAYGLPGSLGNYQNLTLFEDTLQSAKTLGFNGSLCIHPNQVSLANKVFQPTEQEIEWALAIIAQAGHGGATGGELGMVDAPVVARAKAILASH